ncbi:MAG: small-conductance mechanosensitive channel [Salibacteraceae bacterium]|jgi:small-conductance mechanosensitive channel
MNLTEILEYNIINFGEFHVNIFQIILVLAVFLIVRFLIWSINRIAYRFFKRKKVDKGRQFAFLQVVKYIIYTGAVLLALEAVGISLSILWGGAAALLVGVGLGLQQTFNDLISGLILLIEGTVEVNDVIETNGIIGTVTSIGVRTSKVETLDRISILIPNSKLAGNNATNWSHNKTSTRFQLSIGVAYKSDVEAVTSLLLQATKEHNKILKAPAPEIQFKDFGNSSLDFVIHFYSYEFRRIQFVKSDLRYRIIQLFRKNNIEIPFLQTDLWLRNVNDLVPQQNGTFGYIKTKKE